MPFAFLAVIFVLFISNGGGEGGEGGGGGTLPPVLLRAVCLVLAMSYYRKKDAVTLFIQQFHCMKHMHTCL